MGEEVWDRLSGTRPFASYRWYRYGERAMEDCTPLYVCVSRRGEAVARASFWLVRNEPLPLQPGPLRGALHAFLRVKPLLVCRSPVADASGLVLPGADADPALRGPALRAILETARAYGRRAGASFLMFDYLSPEQTALAEWPGELVAMTLAEPGTCLPVAWESYEAYLKSLSKSAWKDYRRQHNQAERRGVEIRTSLAVDAAEMDDALRLIHGVEARHGAPQKPWARAMLANAAQAAAATWITARVAGRLVGCGLLLADQGVHLATLLGLEEGEPYVYFQIVYRAIRQAIESGAQALRAGSGAYELKQRLGFQIEANNYLRFSGQGRLLGWAGKFAAS